MKRVLYWVLTGSRGGRTRARIIRLLNEEPQNANQIAKNLDLDYKTVRHHLGVLSDTDIVTASGPRYAKMYFITQQMEDNWDIFEEIWERIGKK